MGVRRCLRLVDSRSAVGSPTVTSSETDLLDDTGVCAHQAEVSGLGALPRPAASRCAVVTRTSVWTGPVVTAQVEPHP